MSVVGARVPGRSPVDELIELPGDEQAGLRRARAAALLMLALPGGAYIYQGAELGLPEVEDIPQAALVDPMVAQSGGASRGRDGCRVPLPWSGDHPPYGFSPDHADAPWLPQPHNWSGLTRQAESNDPDSTLAMYRQALRIRREHPALGDGTMQWHTSPEGALRFTRAPAFTCLTNITDSPIPLPRHAAILLCSDPTFA